ncbi:MAG: outer membrane receptor protein involved in Fe transport [Pseudohongiellaceae bacterium]|jgi:outer membrane receptor protein involved in Fe transport
MNKFLVSLLVALVPNSSFAIDVIEELNVIGRKTNLIGSSVSASEGYVDQFEIKLRPMLRPGEILELVPGMVATQHSGSGKANQYFLRGFNLDHGTDFATFVDGMPVNMRTHGHGQGYTDINFIISEVVDNLAYKKGPYYVKTGDFSGAGSASISTANTLKEGELAFHFGEDKYQRILITNSENNVLGGDFLYAVEIQQYDGPWTDISEDADKTNFLFKHTRRINEGDLSITFMGYDNSWNSADQIPERAVNSGLINELGSLDTNVGGESSRYSLSTEWKADRAYFSAYVIDYDLDLFSNFTYFLDDAVNGDQFEQVDNRRIIGGQGHYHFVNGKMRNTIGADLRYDDIAEVALYKSKNRQRLGAIKADELKEYSIGLYAQNQMQWTDKLKITIGVRFDYFDFDVDTLIDTNINNIDVSDNGGNADDSNVTLKASASYQFTKTFEGYVSAGQGFHSNDARGTTIVVDPVEGTDVDPVDPIVDSLGYELGFRSFITDALNVSGALWYLELDSELLFVGDAGNTEATRSSERQGIELTAYYRLNDVWTIDIEYAYSDAEFTNQDPNNPSLGNKIPGAIGDVVQFGISANFKNGYYGSFRVRYFGEEPLEENGEIVGESATIANAMIAKDWKSYGMKLEILNLFDSDDRDIEYFYESRFASEIDPVEDIHYKVFEPRTFRISGHIKF